MPLLAPLLALLPLDRLPRTGWALRGVTAPESVAGHTLSLAQVVLALAPRVDPPLALERALVMALVHDVPEAASGDLPRRAAAHLPEGAKAAMEGALAEELLRPLSDDAAEAYAEYQSQETREARFVKIADKLQLGVRLVGYVHAGHCGLEEFQDGLNALDCTEFPVAEELRQEIFAALAPDR